MGYNQQNKQTMSTMVDIVMLAQLLTMWVNKQNKHC